MSTEKISKQNSSAIVIDDGSVKEQIKNKFGDVIGEFVFRPGDVGIYKRFNEVADKFETVVEPLEKIGINSDGTADDISGVEAVNESEKRLYELIDYVFNAKASEAFFGKMNPFSIVGGEFYCEKALAALGEYISKNSAKETKKFNRNISKYTDGYSGSKKSK